VQAGAGYEVPVSAAGGVTAAGPGANEEATSGYGAHSAYSTAAAAGVTSESSNNSTGFSAEAEAEVDATQARPFTAEGTSAATSTEEPQVNAPAAQVTKRAPKAHARKKSHPALAGFVGGVCGVAVVGALVWAIAPATLSNLTGSSSSNSNVVSTASGNVINIETAGEDATTAEVVAAKCLPSVASLTVTTSSGSGVGSAVLLDTEGNLITNYHVVEGATSIVVMLDGKNYDGEVVGSDASSDLAVVKIDLDGASVTPMQVGDSDELVIGEWVMSIGSPFGLEQSVTTGIVSAFNRSNIMNDTSGNTIYANLIQTDAAINPGNSGGALVNSKGELIGINSLIESTSGSSSGVGFAIPANYAVKVAKTIIAGDTVEHAYLGVVVRSVTPDLASSYNLSTNEGAYIESVTSGSPAEAAGLEKGDVIVELGGIDITSGDGLILAVRSQEVGDEVSLTYYRGTEKVTTTVTMGSDLSAAAQETQNYGNSGSSDSGSGSDSGLGSDLYGYDLNDLLEQWLGQNLGGSSNGYGYNYGQR
jgi:putative serine protease PepD